ncbi:mothers against decapentaplegic-like 6 [Sarcoptes scabiei]|nr:mothers against decapentaplegic-like 6 [Sarcoptes scabiei]
MASLFQYLWNCFATIRLSLPFIAQIKLVNRCSIILLFTMMLSFSILSSSSFVQGSKVWCYECESINDPYCSDPFNITFDYSLMKMCEGFCVKMVLEKNSPKKNIWRTCTSRLQINLFMVDHVCMDESGGQGHMCFCESDGCNSVHRLDQFAKPIIISVYIVFKQIFDHCD